MKSYKTRDDAFVGSYVNKGVGQSTNYVAPARDNLGEAMLSEGTIPLSGPFDDAFALAQAVLMSDPGQGLDEDTLVHRSGDELVGGSKTFTDALTKIGGAYVEDVTLRIDAKAGTYRKIIIGNGADDLWIITVDGETGVDEVGGDLIIQAVDDAGAPNTPITIKRKSSDLITLTRGLNTDSYYYVNGTMVVREQQLGMVGTVASATSGATYGATERQMLQDAHDASRILNVLLRQHGLIAT